MGLKKNIVTAAISAVNTQAGTSYTVQATDNNALILFTSGSAVTVTVPAGLPANFACLIQQAGAGAVTLGGAATLEHPDSHTGPRAQSSLIALTYKAADTFILSGDTV